MKRLHSCLIVLTAFCCSVAGAHDVNDNDALEQRRSVGDSIHDVAIDAKDYVLAPLHWDRDNWLFLGSTIAATAAAHAFDRDVRDHFLASQNATGAQHNQELKDAVLPMAVVLGTAAYAGFTGDRWGRRETWSMLEAAGLGGLTSYALKFAAGRERPSDTPDVNAWRQGGDSFPSLHVTAAFAVGGVLAESGGDEYRWIRRVLGYGIGAATAYERLKHNTHWLSDTVIGAGVGLAAAQFVVHRNEATDRQRMGSFLVAPSDGGILLTYHHSF